MLNRPFDGPIPGESLTQEPKKFAWERPPEFVDPEDALMFYLDKIMNAKTMGKIMDSLELGVPIRKLVEGIVRTGVSEGLHTIDVSLLVAPAIHETIRGVAEDLEVEYEEGLVDKEAEREEELLRERLKTKAKIRKLTKQDMKTLRSEDRGEMTTEEPMEEQLELPIEPKRGLMAREDI